MTRPLLAVCFALAITSTVPAQAPEPPLAETRLTVHTLLREDIFAGFLQNDLARLARAEKNIDLLLASRPDERASLLAWQGGTQLTRAAQANEAKQSDQFRQHYRRALESFAEARQLGPTNVGVFAINGGSQLMLADRLPEKERAASWEEAYAAYQQLWKMQGEAIDKLPLHHKGEVLTGLAQSSQRTGRDTELASQLDRILTLLPNTAYAKMAQQWKENPASRGQSKLACQTCHGPGTLVVRLAEIVK
jgi:tetratricopeptide (TPR) repeat protein